MKLPMYFLAMTMAQAINMQSRPACTSVEGSCKTATAADPNIDTRTVFNLPAGSVVNNVDGGQPGPVGPPFPQAINVLLEEMSRPACTSVEGSCKTKTAAAPNLDTRTVFNLPAGSVVNNVDGGPPGPVGPPFPQAYNVQLEQQSRPACTSVEGSCKTATAADPNIDTRTVFNLPAGSVVNNVDGGQPGPVGPPFPQAINVLLEQMEMSRPACTSVDGSCKTATAADPNIDTRTVFNLPAGSVVNNVDGGQPGPVGPPFPQAINVQLEEQSVPACNSVGCKKGSAAFLFKGQEKNDWPMDYVVPNFGTDKEMLASQQHLAAMEKTYGKWDYNGKHKDDYPTNYKVPNFGIDVDIMDTVDSEKSSSDLLAHKWAPKVDANGVWKVPQPIDNASYSYM